MSAKVTDYEILKKIGAMSDHTPDYYDLKHSEYERHLVLIVDTFKKGHPQHGFLDGADYYGISQTLTARYTMKRVPNHRMSYIFETKRVKGPRNKSAGTFFRTCNNAIVPADKVGKIEGELYSLSLRHLCQLDKLMLNGNQFQRELTWVELTAQVNKNKHVQAWMYMATPKSMDNVSISLLSDPIVMRRNSEMVMYAS